MASFRGFIPVLAVIFSFSQCRPAAPSPGNGAVPAMSKEDGNIIISREINVWEYSKTKQFDKLREILADDYTGHFTSGNLQPGDAINLLKNTTINSYHLSDIVVKPVADNVAVIYYKVDQDVTSAGGDKWIPQIAASSVYVKRKGVWYSVFYQEMPAKQN